MESDSGNSETENIRILMIEDDNEDALILRRSLAKAAAGKFHLKHARRLSTGLNTITAEAFDAVLLDLNLPDETGLDTLGRVYQHAPHLPIIVLTGTDDEDLALRAVHMGAQDYLVKGQIDGNSLMRSIRYAVERHQLMTELEHARQREQQLEEMQSIERLSATSVTAVTAQALGVPSLREGLPDTFDEYAGEYGELLNLALEQRAYRVEHNVSAVLRSMADALGFLKAGPRDVVEIHTTALKQKSDGVNMKCAQAFIEEGRLMVLELMGYLVSYYRNYAIGFLRKREDDRGIGSE